MSFMIYLILALVTTGFYVYFNTNTADSRTTTTANMFLAAAIFAWLGFALCLVKSLVKNQDRIGEFVDPY